MLIEPLRIELQQAGVRYGYTWIVRNVNYTFSQAKTYAILGNNGSGKSTLLQMIAGSKAPSEGQVVYHKQRIIQPENFHRHIGWAAPYMGLPEELQVAELISFHAKFKRPDVSLDDILEIIMLEKDKRKEIRQLSSGMKQRLKLGLAFLYECEFILLDEPTSHLDKHGVAWYHSLVQNFRGNRGLIVASNQEQEYAFVEEQIEVRGWKV